jgi:hypothetical protein
MPTLSVIYQPEDIQAFTNYLEAMGKRVSGQGIRPILLKHLQPLVALEKGNIHSESGALSASLAARAGGGDRPNVISVFSSSKMTRAKLIKKWSGGRRQQKKWAFKLAPKGGAKRVFYDEMVELGHRIVYRDKAGNLVQSRKRPRTAPVYFARRAAEQGAEQALDAAETEVMNFIVGG